MPVQVTILGLGQIGKSIGLALASHGERVLRVGHDRDPEITRQAKTSGAVDRMSFNLHDAVKNARIVLLCISLDEMRPTLEQIAPDLQPEAILMDTAPVKSATAHWIRELAPEHAYIGLFPVPHLGRAEIDPFAPNADLFRDMPIFLAAAPGLAENVFNSAINLIDMLGATPLFIDMAEIDGLTASAQTLPQLTAAALCLASTGQPGWVEGTKATGLPYSAATLPLEMTSSGALHAEATLNRNNVLRALDELIHSLQSLRSIIADDDGQISLEPHLERAIQARNLWWSRRATGDWETNPPSLPQAEKPDLITRWFGVGGLLKKRR
jgi:prephenate dehydrogenase